jgi:hypothetical protein
MQRRTKYCDKTMITDAKETKPWQKNVHMTVHPVEQPVPHGRNRRI